MAKYTVCISLEEAVRNFNAVLARVHKGKEVMILAKGRAVAIVSPPEPHKGRLLSESIALAAARGSTATMDADFAKDVEAAIESHQEPFEPPEWN